jgi:hypothetical protein
MGSPVRTLHCLFWKRTQRVRPIGADRERFELSIPLPVCRFSRPQISPRDISEPKLYRRMFVTMVERSPRFRVSLLLFRRPAAISLHLRRLAVCLD